MIPFLHLGPLSIPTYGLMVSIGLLVAAYILQADFNRHRALFAKKGYLKDEKSQGDEGFLVIGMAGIAGLIGSRIYSVLESPREFIANPSMLFSRFGFTWFGGFLAGVIALVFLARHFQIPVLEFIDLCSAPAALGYALGRMGCLLSGDGDYGIPTTLPWGMSFPNGIVPTLGVCAERGLPLDCRVHPTPIYEFLAWVIIAAFLWRMGKKAARGAGSHGEIFGVYLILTGVARFLVEFIRLNPKVLYGMTNAQVVSILSICFGAILLWRARSEASLRSKPA